MRLGQTSILYFIMQILASTIGFLATIYFTRTLGEETYGLFAITLSLVSSLGIIKSIGFGSATVKRMSEGEESDAYFIAGIIIKTLLNIVIIGGVILFQDSINTYVGAPVANFVIYLLVVYMFLNIVSSGLKGTHRVHIYALISTGTQVSRSIIMAMLVFFGWGLAGMLTGRIIGTIPLILIGFWIIKPKLVTPEMYHFQKLVDFAKFSWLGKMRKRTFSDADILVLGLLVPAGLAGVYAVAYSLSKFLNIFGNAIKTTLFPEMSKLSADEDTDMVGTLTTDALTFSGLFLIPGVVGATIIGDRLMRIYGPGFERGSTVLVILLLGILMYTYTKQLLNTLNAIDRPDLAFRTNAIFIVINIVLNLLLVWSIGWTGAAIATASSATIGLLLSYYYSKQYISFTFPVSEISRQCVSSIFMGVVIYITTIFMGSTLTLFDGNNTLFVVTVVCIGAIVYFTCYTLISSKFRKTVISNAPLNLHNINGK